MTNANLTIRTDRPRAIGPDLFGVFFEDINYAADGGLYAELIQNRSFAYSPADRRDWDYLTAWEVVPRGGACAAALGTDAPVHPNNPHYLVLSVDAESGAVALKNDGYDGIPLRAGERYRVSLFARTLSGRFAPLSVRLESAAGDVLGEATLPAPSAEWARYAATVACGADDTDARFVVQVSGAGALALDVVSLFPERTFRDRPNGMRPDLAQAIADLKPRFVRFPGGCLAHGDGLDNMYRWKDTIGPIERRKEQPNIWNYHQSVGLGYFEYFQFCEDIGAKPVPVVPAGVCCQNTGAKVTGKWGEGQCGLPLEEMPAYIQEVLDLIEWANGPATSTWGARRAEAGHPEPFGLEYLGIGNEDHISPVFEERFRMIHEAVKARHPEITVIGTTGPFHSGHDYDAGWKIANALNLEMVDEHYYETPDWFWQNLERYDAYDRGASAVYVGEYAAHETDRRSTLRSALAEAACMTALERNGDIVRLASYAPLLARVGHTQWVPDLLYFDNATVSPTVNYYVQQIFSRNGGDAALPVELTADTGPHTLAASCVRDGQGGDLIVKIVSRAGDPVRVRIDLAGAGNVEPEAACTTLAGDPLAENRFGEAPALLPRSSTIPVGKRFVYEAPAHSLSVIRVKAR